MIQLNKRSKTPLYEQIYNQIQHGIADGIYPPESKLPSIRALAETLRCSRNTVEAAYRLLMQEGFVQSRPGSGFVVERRAADGSPYGQKRSFLIDETEDDASTLEIIEEIFAETALEESEDEHNPLVECKYDFTYGNLQRGTFPALEWKSIIDDILLSVEATKADAYSNSNGELSLRREIARMVAVTRGIRCHPDQVIVQGGTQASLQNLLVLFNPATDVVAMEEPGYDGSRSVFERSHFKMIPLPVGITSDLYLDTLWNSNARLMYSTPSFQFPLGLVMDEHMREEVLQWANHNDAYIIEDDYCCEFNYRNSPLPALASLDDKGRVIYMGTFSKSLSPGLRMNYLILPPSFLDKWQEAFDNAYPAVCWLNQEVLARYLRDSHRERHLRRIQVRCRRKYELLTSALRKTMGDKVEIIEGGAGLHLLVNVLDGRSQGELIAQAREKGVRVYGTDKYWMEENHRLKSCVLIGFSAIDEDDIVPGVKTLAEAWFGDR